MHESRIDEKDSASPTIANDSGDIWRTEGRPLDEETRREPRESVTGPSPPSPRVEPDPGPTPAPRFDLPQPPWLGDGPRPRADGPAPRPGDECPELPEEDPEPPPGQWNADPCAPLSSEGRSEGRKWVPDTPLLSDPTHPDHALFKQALSHLQRPGLCDRFDSEAQRERVAAAIAAEAKEAGLKGIDHVVVGRQGGPFIAIEGPNPYAPEARRATVDYAEAVGRSVEQSTAKITPEACTFKPGEERLLSELTPPAVSTPSPGTLMLR